MASVSPILVSPMKYTSNLNLQAYISDCVNRIGNPQCLTMLTETLISTTHKRDSIILIGLWFAYFWNIILIY